MQDRWEHEIGRRTEFGERERVKCKISPGTLKSLMVYFPPGCENLARCRVLLGEKPVMPRSASNYIAADGMAVEADELDEPIREDLPVLNWEVWNEDQTYGHTIWLAAEWISEDEPHEKRAADLLADFVGLMKRLIGAR